MNILSPKNLNLGEQAAGIKRQFPEVPVHIHGHTLTWTGNIIGHPLGRSYTTEIVYRLGSVPQTRVLAPCIVSLAEGRSVPHLYSQAERRLCLYHPSYREWDASKYIGQTIVPWTATWLYFFEEWLYSNDWKGGGEHPPDISKEY